ncbi:hypothetical protein BM1_04114 [Bipolaris maydis]|nr:hypothetical protein BM1_04114 [Bipolaris maydis]
MADGRVKMKPSGRSVHSLRRPTAKMSGSDSTHRHTQTIPSSQPRHIGASGASDPTSSAWLQLLE